MVLRTNIMGACPGGFCDYIQEYSEVLVVILCIDGFIFFVTLLPPLFSWASKKPDGRKRIFFAGLACVTLYFWLAFLALNSLYCFGFLAHEGPCRHLGGSRVNMSTTPATLLSESVKASSDVKATLLTTTSMQTVVENDEVKLEPLPESMALISWTSSKVNTSCVTTPANEHETQLKNLTLVNILILVVLFVVFIANAKEAMTAKALYYKETLCKKDEVQRFLSSLVLKPPEVGHLINCFHMANTETTSKSNNTTASAAAAAGTKSKLKSKEPSRKVITFSAIENFSYGTWRDFSDLRLIEPSPAYPIIEIEIVLNFFPGDHYTAERYKAFVTQMTKEHSSKDGRITIDDYFHIEDHREWTFFIGNDDYISPWWDKDPAKIMLSCLALFGWPFRMSYHGRIAKHQVEVKKAVFVENTSNDEGVSLSATPGSGSNTNEEAQQQQVNPDNAGSKNDEDEDDIEEDEVVANHESNTSSAHQLEPENLGGNEHRVDAVISGPPRLQEQQQVEHMLQQLKQQAQEKEKEMQLQQQLLHQQLHPLQQPGPSLPTTMGMYGRPHPAFGHPLAHVLPATPPMPPQRSAQISSPRTHLRETTKDIVTAVTHQDINGVNAVNTVALKDMDVQMTALSGYETYV